MLLRKLRIHAKDGDVAEGQGEGDKGEQGKGGGSGGEGQQGDAGKAEGDKGGLAAAARAAAAAKSGEGKEGDKGEGDKGKAADRPDWLPEQFWNKDTKQPNIEALAKSYKDTRAAHDALKGAKAPAKPEDYKFEPAADSKFKVEKDDPLLGIFRTAAHKHGIPQEAFQSIVGDVLAGIFEGLPAPIDPAEEVKKLGANGQAVVDGVVGWITGLESQGALSKEEADEIINIGSTANGIKALAKIMARAGEKPIPLDAAPAGEGLPSKEELYAMVAKPEYRTDEGYRNKVDGLFKKVFGNAPASTAGRGIGVPAGRAMMG